MSNYPHQGAPTQFVEAAGIRFAYRRLANRRFGRASRAAAQAKALKGYSETLSLYVLEFVEKRGQVGQANRTQFVRRTCFLSPKSGGIKHSLHRHR